MKVKKIDINKLQPASYNPRQISTKQYKDLKESVNRFGVVDPIIINKDMTVIGGHQRLKVCKDLKHTEIDCVVLDLTKEEERELNIRLNKSGGEFDMDILANEFDVEELKDWGFKDIDFGFNIDKIVEGNTEDDHIPEAKESRVKLGDVWELGNHRLMCGDSTKESDVKKLMNGDKADMVFTDPPYGVDYKGINNDNKEGLENLLYMAFKNKENNCKEGAAFYCFHSDRCADIFHSIYRQFCHFSSMLIWVKESIVLSQTDYQSKHENCIYGWFKNGTHKWYGDRKQQSVYTTKRERVNGHTTPKPVEFITMALNNSSKTKDIILDLFLGSGSTLIACEKTNRICYGMELDTKYCDVIIERWEQFTGQKAKKCG
jgi:DNA modification methylase